MGIISYLRSKHRERYQEKNEWKKIYRERIKLKEFRREYRKKNQHNLTVPANIFNLDYLSVGTKTYGLIKILGGESFEEGVTGIRKVIIGSYCSIGPDVTFIPHLDHYTNHISTYPFKVQVMGEKFEAISKGDIVIDDDVWIGYGATILSGVHIGQGAIIMAGAVVTKDIPPYAMAGGVPAKVIKYRFNENIIRRLLAIDFSKLDDELIREHINELYETVNENTDLSWLPLKPVS